MHSILGVTVDDEEVRKIPAIAIVGVGGGGSRILSEGLDKINKLQDIDRYSCIAKVIRADSEKPHVFIVDTSSDPNTKGFYTNIPKDHKISLSGSIKGMSRGAGGKPGRAAKALLNKEVSRTLAEKFSLAKKVRIIPLLSVILYSSSII